ncbi:hypothetical protein [Streptosporangium subroseum]|uniref:hypothetical protein n=1 Tax=Streptosporangium subroseum TaxID=106412 RepID=UPI0030855F52|nr:hypothetical protein OHB15_48360 [Streptosporangium subroseum]
MTFTDDRDLLPMTIARAQVAGLPDMMTRGPLVGCHPLKPRSLAVALPLVCIHLVGCLVEYLGAAVWGRPDPEQTLLDRHAVDLTWTCACRATGQSLYKKATRLETSPASRVGCRD